MTKKIIYTTALIPLFLTACTQKTIINPIPLDVVQNTQLQQPIEKGFISKYESHNDEWAKYAIRLKTGCPVSLFDLSSPEENVDVPVFESEGHIQKIYTKDNYSLYISPHYYKEYTGKSYITLKVSLSYNDRTKEKLFTKTLELPDGTIGENLPASYPLWRFESNRIICSIQPTVLASSATLSKKIWYDGIGKDQINNTNHMSYGNQLPQERSGETLTDVMHSNGTSNFKSPDFHDPFNVNQGGMGSMVK